MARRKHCITRSLLYCVRSLSADLLGFGDEFVSVVPIRQQICSLLIVHPDVMVLEDAWEEVIYFSSDIQNVPHPVWKQRADKIGQSLQGNGFALF